MTLSINGNINPGAGEELRLLQNGRCRSLMNGGRGGSSQRLVPWFPPASLLWLRKAGPRRRLMGFCHTAGGSSTRKRRLPHSGPMCSQDFRGLANGRQCSWLLCSILDTEETSLNLHSLVPVSSHC
uniref:Uncharacterized protein n=1 Tax=Rousettus aegyptiacus TaxID=9407 RepID=A0A7J8GB67_ROUAE|nr:hypothetical protein HJG63_011719 [Rousettus aegyptiacus]